MKGALLFIVGILILNFNVVADSYLSDNLARISVLSGKHERFDTPLSISLDDITSVNEAELKLYELINGKLVGVAIQFSVAEQRHMHWLLSGRTEPHKTRVFVLKKEVFSTEASIMKIERQQDLLILYSGNKPVVQYNAGIVFPPEGANPAYRRSGFIHPLFAPNGFVLTNIQPADHIHHYGIWNPWTKTTFRGEEIDFWNLAKEQGRVQFSGLSSVNEGDIFGSIQVLHDHVVWPCSLRETTAMNELQEIKVFHRSDGAFLLEINSRLSPLEKLILEEYRYGGLVIRASDYWTNENSYLFTSEGLDRDQADGQRAMWCVLTGDTPGGEVSILIMGHPSNYNHPEPLRVWPSNANRGRGDHFINFSPTRNTQWVLNPGKNYLLRYRMLVAEGKINKKSAERIWNDFSNFPEITIEK